MIRISKGWFKKHARQNEEYQNTYQEGEVERQERWKTLTTNEKKLFGNRELYLLAFEFGYIYRLQFKYGEINISESIKQAKNANGYDVDIFTILHLMKVIHKNYPTNKKIPVSNYKLICAWGLSLDKKYLKMHGNIRNNKNLDGVTKLRKPNDYENFLKNGDMDKLIDGNSLHKYKARAINNGLRTKLISFLGNILSEIDNYEISGEHPEGYINNIITIYKVGFENIIEKLPIRKIRRETNMQYIMRKNKNNFYSNVLDFANKKYQEDLYEYFKLH